jgi:hypothetical protein
MVRKSVRIIACLFALGTITTPAIGSAQDVRYDSDQPSVVVECGPGQRAVMEQRRVNGRAHVVARCEESQFRARRSSLQSVDRQYVERPRQRTKTKTALMIAGSAATGAGVGGAMKGRKGALVGAAIGGGAASIYEAVKRR